MHVVTISDRTDYLFPFSQMLWEDRHVVYHGSWSTYSPRIEAAGFGHTELPFNHEHVNTIARAWAAVGTLDSYAQLFFRNSPGRPRPELSMTGNFWNARAYATDGGGEVVRMMLQDARAFESLCTTDERLALKRHWEDGLKRSPGHQSTISAVRLLGDLSRMHALCEQVRAAREGIEAVTKDGFPVVYAIRIEPEWFGEEWERYICRWEEGDRGPIELVCRRELISPDRILAKAVYPNGVADSEFSPDGFKTWDELQTKLPEWMAWRRSLRSEVERAKKM
jgi:hypothetical protein